jgi:hypothetical protein
VGGTGGGGLVGWFARLDEIAFSLGIECPLLPAGWQRVSVWEGGYGFPSLSLTPLVQLD